MSTPEWRAAYHKRYRAAKKATGLCIHYACDKPPKPGQVRCQEHALYMKRYQDSYRLKLARTRRRTGEPERRPHEEDRRVG